MANSLVFFTDIMTEIPHLLRIQTPLTFLYGPLLYFIILSYHQKNTFIKKDAIHLLPFLIIILSLIPIYLMSGNEKYGYLQTMINSGHIDSIIYGLLRRMHILFYLLMSLGVIKNIKTNRQTVIYIWISFLGIWLISMYRFIFDFDLSSVYLDMIYINCVVIYLAFVITADVKPKQSPKAEEKKELKIIMEKINSYLIENEGLKDNLLSISTLQKELKIADYKISRAINFNTGKHFFDYINQIRVNKAKEILKARPKMRIEDIAFEVGYNSISVFNTAFKKVVHMSPREFRKLSTSENR
ncbi:MAG: AraC family transcriptional regulator [Calditrichaeota bacterium]|nr:AraC family transcriptional regulator [Calditrichota bacterium]